MPLVEPEPPGLMERRGPLGLPARLELLVSRVKQAPWEQQGLWVQSVAQDYRETPVFLALEGLMAPQEPLDLLGLPALLGHQGEPG